MADTVAPHQATTWATGRVAALGIQAVLADTGALPAGVYDFEVNAAVADVIAAGVGIFIEHRNAANGATLKDLGGTTPGGGGVVGYKIRNYRLAANERVRLVGGSAAAGAASLSVGAIGYTRVGAE
jgi:hypothetical protein